MDPRQFLHSDRIATPAAGERAIQLNEDAAETDGPVAVVDIGSNSIRLAIIETDGHDFLEVLEEARAVPKLIRDVNAHGSLSDESIETVLDVLRDFVEGPHPFNPSGGNLGNGRTRTAMYTDCIEQLRGIAGARQIQLKAETAACGMVTPTGNGHIYLSTVAD